MGKLRWREPTNTQKIVEKQKQTRYWTAAQKPEITGKHSEKRKKTIYWNQKNSEYQNTSYVGARFLHVAWQGVAGAVRQLCHWPGPFQTWTATSSFDRVTRRHVAIGTIQQTQDAASVLWVYRHNSWHAAWPTVILRFTRMETRWKTLALSPRKLNETKVRE